MSKRCNFEGCTNEISQWQTLCATHYAQTIQDQVVTQEPPKVPPHKVLMPPQQMKEVGKIIDAPIKPKPSILQDISTKDRVEIRKVCLQCAIDLITKTEFEDRTFDTLRGEIETLTEEFYLIIVKL